MSDWAEIVSPPDETSALLVEGMPKENYAVALIPEPALVEARHLRKGTTDSW